MDTSLPSREALKAHAKRLRNSMDAAGTPISHALALEAVAQQWGYRDWNTLSARAEAAPAIRWQIGQAVQGHYLGQGFTGRIKAAHQSGGGYWRLTLVFDTPVDVVTSPLFSSFRKQINCTVNSQGVTVAATSDGQPHVVLRARSGGS
ncbi:glyoxalase superfamily protein [Thalassovita taeanensis]|uniref:Glyoxalase-related protein domain-containing protein n=1 Tax=Thalassovita taeanensis TaxID=657014 RepID=A0A1H9HSB4_9RHOB|nr:glyoxalase superfamily protein [Thalassovita taeanensis]SEQ65213.1 hypothetical protein SAMN04488092_11064 [Thalassovita taeanensis]